MILGISVNGIMVIYPNTQTTQFYRYLFRKNILHAELATIVEIYICFRWKDISNVINHKKTFRIECQAEGEEPKQFIFTESRNAKYVWRLCIAQHTFYMQHQESRPMERSTNGYFVSSISFKRNIAPRTRPSKISVSYFRTATRTIREIMRYR